MIVAVAVLLAQAPAANAHPRDILPGCNMPVCGGVDAIFTAGRARIARSDALEGQRAAMASLVDSAAAGAGVPSAIARAVIRHESNFNPNTTGRAGEIGLGQIKCQTARGVGFTGSCSMLYDPQTNLRFSMAYLRIALDRGGSGCSGVALYQRGVYGRASCSGYGRAVMARVGRW
jgi:soluble lytic murein transglycosylase-like protein